MVALPKGWRELQQMNREKQTGETEYVPDEVGYMPDGIDMAYARMIPRSPAEDREYEQLNAIESAGFGTDWNKIANETGYGDWRRDDDVSLDQFAQNPNEYRAQRQTQLGKLVNGAVKMVPYTAATFIDNTAGLVDSILNIGIDAINGGEFHPVDSFIDTFTADKMQQFRDWSDRVLPNYRTEEEIADADQWWKHLNGNFWGDTVLKNLGFTIGAGLSGAAFAKGFQALKGKTFSDIYKAGLAAATGGAEEEAAFQRILQGARMRDPSRIYVSTEAAMNAVKRMNASSQLIGGVGGAIGESRMEGLMAAKEFRDEFAMRNQMEFEQARQELLNELLSDETGTFSYDQHVYDGFGNVTGKTTRALTETGQRRLNQELANLRQVYNQKMGAVDEQADKLAQTTFFLNMPLLTATNIIQFGRMFSGGWGTQLKTRVNGPLGNMTGKGSVLGSVSEGLWNAVSEGVEEVSQKIFSEGAKSIGSKNLAAFNNGKYDEDAIRSVSDWMLSMIDSAEKVLIDPKTWEEFAVGFLTGAIGIPSSHISNWQGGIIGGIVQAENERSENQALAEKLNELVGSKEFKDRWEGMVRHEYYDAKMEQDLGENNRFAWQTDRDSQILSDVLTFAKAGRLQDLYNIVDSFGNERLTLADMPEMRAMMREGGEEGDLRLIDNLSDQELLDWFHERSEETKRTIDQYNRLYNSVNYLAFGTSDEKAIEELIYTQAQLENFENRYNNLFDKTVQPIIESLRPISSETKKDGTLTKRARAAQDLIKNAESIRTLFGGRASDIRAREADNKNFASFVATAIDNATQDRALNTLEQLGVFENSPELKQNVKDLQELIRSRQYFYARLFDPQNRGKFQENFYKEAKTDLGTAQELKAKANKDAVDAAVEELKKTQGPVEYMRARLRIMKDMDDDARNQLSQAISKEQTLAPYEASIADVGAFLDGVERLIDKDIRKETDQSAADMKQRVLDIVSNFYVDDAIANATDPEDLIGSAVNMLHNQIGADPAANQYLDSIVRQKQGNMQSSEEQGTIDDNSKGVDVPTTPETPAAPAAPESTQGRQSLFDEDGNFIDEEPQPQQPEVETDEQASLRFMEDIEHINNVTDAFDPRLVALANGEFGDRRFLSDHDPQYLIQEAKKKQRELLEGPQAPPALPTSVRAEQLNPRESTKDHEARVAQDVGSLSGAAIEVYDSSELRKGRKVPARADRQTPAVNWFNAHKVQEVTDSGALSDIDKAYREKGQQMPVYFLANPKIAENNPFSFYSQARKRSYSNVLFAIEIDENGPAADVIRRYQDMGLFADDHLVEVDGKKYQVIGELRYPNAGIIASLAIGEAEQNAYRDTVEKYNRTLKAVLEDSIEKQEASDAGQDFGPDGKWYVAQNANKRLTSTLDYITTGRNETREAGHDEYKDIPLGTSLADYRKTGRRLHFAMRANQGATQPGGIVTSWEAPMVDDATRNSTPYGSLLVGTEQADGSFVWTLVDTASTRGFDFVGRRGSSSYVQDIYSNFNELFKRLGPEHADYMKRRLEIDKKIQAANELNDTFYFGGDGIIFSVNPDGSVSLSVGEARDITSTDAAIEALRDQDVRFQVKRNDVMSENYSRILDMADAGILTSPMRSFVRMGATFGVNYLDADLMPEKSNRDNVPSTPRTNQQRGQAPAVVATETTEDGTVYQLYSDGVVMMTTTPGAEPKVVTDPDVIDFVIRSARYNNAMKPESQPKPQQEQQAPAAEAPVQKQRRKIGTRPDIETPDDSTPEERVEKSSKEKAKDENDISC